MLLYKTYVLPPTIFRLQTKQLSIKQLFHDCNDDRLVLPELQVSLIVYQGSSIWVAMPYFLTCSSSSNFVLHFLISRCSKQPSPWLVWGNPVIYSSQNPDNHHRILSRINKSINYLAVSGYVIVSILSEVLLSQLQANSVMLGVALRAMYKHSVSAATWRMKEKTKLQQIRLVIYSLQQQTFCYCF